MAKVTAVTTAFPYNRTDQILTQSKNSGIELKQTIFTYKNARFLSISAIGALWTYASLVVGALQGGQREANLVSGAVPALCET